MIFIERITALKTNCSRFSAEDFRYLIDPRIESVKVGN